MGVLPRTRPLVLLATIAAIAAVGVVWGKVAQEIKDATPVPSSSRPTAIVWNDRVFASPNRLRTWLRSRGETYTAWAHEHAAAAAVLEHRPPPVRHVHASRPVADEQRRPAATQSAHRGHSVHVEAILLTIVRWFVLLGFVLVAAAFVVAAALPPLLRSRFPRVAAAAAPHRELLLASAVALVLGVIVGVALS